MFLPIVTYDDGYGWTYGGAHERGSTRWASASDCRSR